MLSSAPRQEDFLPVGVIVKPHGVKGEVVVQYAAESTDLLNGILFVQRTGATRSARSFEFLSGLEQGLPVPLKPARARVHHGVLLLSFTDVVSRDEAELLRGCVLLVPKDRLPPLGEGEAYLHQLPGFTVFLASASGPDVPLGTIVAAATPAGQEIWTIRTPQDKEILFPAVPEFVLDVDTASRLVRIDPPPGLLDIYLE